MYRTDNSSRSRQRPAFVPCLLAATACCQLADAHTSHVCAETGGDHPTFLHTTCIERNRRYAKNSSQPTSSQQQPVSKQQNKRPTRHERCRHSPMLSSSSSETSELCPPSPSSVSSCSSSSSSLSSFSPMSCPADDTIEVRMYALPRWLPRPLPENRGLRVPKPRGGRAGGWRGESSSFSSRYPALGAVVLWHFCSSTWAWQR